MTTDIASSTFSNIEELHTWAERGGRVFIGRGTTARLTPPADVKSLPMAEADRLIRAGLIARAVEFTVD